jgi:hypothetical protein
MSEIHETVTVTVEQVEAALRKYLAILDYDLHKGIECNEETGEDDYADEAADLYGHLISASTPAPARPAPVVTSTVAAHVLWQASRGGYPAGSFTTQLLTAWNTADDGNAARLTAAFPEYGAALVLLGEPRGVERLRAIAGGESR